MSLRNERTPLLNKKPDDNDIDSLEKNEKTMLWRNGAMITLPAELEQWASQLRDLQDGFAKGRKKLSSLMMQKRINELVDAWLFFIPRLPHTHLINISSVVFGLIVSSPVVVFSYLAMMNQIKCVTNAIPTKYGPVLDSHCNNPDEPNSLEGRRENFDRGLLFLMLGNFAFLCLLVGAGFAARNICHGVSRLKESRIQLLYGEIGEIRAKEALFISHFLSKPELLKEPEKIEIFFGELNIPHDIIKLIIAELSQHTEEGKPTLLGKFGLLSKATHQTLKSYVEQAGTYTPGRPI